MEDKGYPVYQWSKFVNGERGEQVVVRADNIDDFKLRVEQMKNMLNKSEPREYTREPVEAPKEKVNWKKCERHGKFFNGDKFTQCFECARGTSEGKAPSDAF